MALFILILIIIILGSMYIDRLIKYKFGHEKRAIWKIIHIIAFIIVYIPFLGVGYLVWIDSYVIEKGMLVIAVLLYFGYNKYKKYKKN